MEDNDFQYIEDQFDKKLILRKMGIGYLFWIPNGQWCGPWCCPLSRQPRHRRPRKRLRWWHISVSGWSKRKTLRTHRNGKFKK